MKVFSLWATFGLLCLAVALVHGQDQPEQKPTTAAPAEDKPKPPPAQSNRPANQDEPAGGAAQGAGAQGAQAGGEEAEGKEAKEDECEEAWEYVEFMKKSIKDKIEEILQNTLFQPRPLLEETVTQTMEKVLEIRDEILARTKSIRSQDGEVVICPEQNIKQEEFLTQVRMQVMGILLSLIEKDAASSEKLQDIGKQLLAIRSKVNAEITRMIMLRETTATVRKSESECDCGILGEVVDGLDGVLEKEDDTVKAEGDEEENADAAAGAEGGNPMEQLTMVLMTIDSEIKALYSQILNELDDTTREELSKELQNLKSISTDLHQVLSKLSTLDPEEDKDAIDRLVRREIRSIRNEVKRLLDNCTEKCPGECDSCGAEKIDEVAEKLKDYKANLEDLDEQDAKESIRADLMTFLTATNTEMTELLKEKAEKGELDECGTERLEVIDKIKGPLWMMVNITIFGDADTMNEMIDALDKALAEMRSQYCGAEPLLERIDPIVSDECDLNEINTARDWIGEIDEIIAKDIFKSEDEEGRKAAMLGLIDLKSNMDNRVRDLFQDNLSCKEEVEQIKNIYMQKLTECLAEMMNPRFRFDLLGRADRVQCVKDLRTQMEDRRGELLMREIENRIKEAEAGAIGNNAGQQEPGNAAPAANQEPARRTPEAAAAPAPAPAADQGA